MGRPPDWFRSLICCVLQGVATLKVSRALGGPPTNRGRQLGLARGVASHRPGLRAKEARCTTQATNPYKAMKPGTQTVLVSQLEGLTTAMRGITFRLEAMWWRRLWPFVTVRRAS